MAVKTAPYTGTRGRKCRVCEGELLLEHRQAVDEALKSGSNMTALVRELDIDVTPTDISYHKTHCLGITPRRRTEWSDLPRKPIPDLGAALVAPPPTELVVLPVWEPATVRGETRIRLLETRDKLEEQLKVTPTAAIFHVLLEYNQEILKQCDQGGNPSDRAAAFRHLLGSMNPQGVELKRVTETVTLTPEGDASS